MGFGLIIANILGWIAAHKKLTAITALVLILAIAAATGGFYLWNGWRASEEAAATAGQIRVDEAAANANVAANVANQSLQNSNAARNANVNTFNSNYSDARKNYCAEFPEDCK